MEWLTALLVWLSADPVAIDTSVARAAAAADCAYASLPRVGKRQEEAKPAAGRATGGKPVLDCPTGTCPLPRR
jgi:hypothetical protein